MKSFIEIFFLVSVITLVNAQEQQEENSCSTSLKSGGAGEVLDEQNFDIIEEDKTAGMKLH